MIWVLISGLTKKFMEDKKPKNSSKLLQFGGVFLLILTALNSWQILSVKSVVDRVDNYNKGVVDELGGVVGDTKDFAHDLNEIRRFLLLPEKDYSVEKNSEQNSPDDQTDPNSLALYAFLNDLNKSEQSEQNRQAVANLLKDWQASDEVKTQLAEYKLETSLLDNWQVKLLDLNNQKQPLLAIVFSPTENLFKLQSVLGEEKIPDLEISAFTTKLNEYLKNNVEVIRQKKIEKIKADQLAAEQAVKNEEARKIKLKDDFEKLLKEKAFSETIGAMGLTVDMQARQEKGNWIYDVKDKDNKVKFSFLVNTSIGQIKVLKDNQEVDLKNFLNQDDGSKKKP